MKFRLSLFLLLFCYISQVAQAQELDKKKKLIERLKNSPTICTMSWVFVDNDGDPDSYSFKSLNKNIIPLSLKVDKNIYKNFSVSAVMCFNRFKSFQEVNNVTLPYSRLFFSFDLNGRIGIKDKHFNLYFLNGLGFSTVDVNRLNAPKSGSLNFGGGLYVKIIKNVGINIESAAKFGLRKPLIKNNSNHFLHTIGFSLFL